MEPHPTEIDEKGTSTGGDTMSGTSTGGTSTGGDTMGGTSTGGDTMSPDPQPTKFTLTIENLSGTTFLPSPLAPGVYAVHTEGGILFDEGVADYGMGLAPLAENGNPAMLAASLGAQNLPVSGIFDTPVDATEAGVAGPGASYEFTFMAMPGESLSLATMLVQSNDLIIATPEDGLSLFEANEPLVGDVSAMLRLWDVGSERNEAPGQGLTQAPRQGDMKGPMEGKVSLRKDGTRALPAAQALLEIMVTESGGTFTLTLKNTSGLSPLKTPLSPVFYALHEEGENTFMAGDIASAGLELLAEGGDPSTLVTESMSAGLMAGAAGAAPFGPGAEVTFMITPTTSDSKLSLSTMIVESNDLLIGTSEGGIALLDDTGSPLNALDVKMSLMKSLRVWDAGTEANEVPGVGPNQPLRGGGGTGDADLNDKIRIYADATHDLMGDKLAEKVSVTVTHKSGTTFDVLVENTSTGSAFPLILTPVVWAIHAPGAPLFTMGEPASSGLEMLAEDGATANFLSEVAAMSSVASSGAVGTGPIMGGSSYSFEVSATMASPMLNLVSMVVPSNDTFLALGMNGIRLVDTSGTPRSDMDIAADIAGMLMAHESGTEANQSGAIGPDMAPHQAAPNTGASEGTSTVRLVDDIWMYPSLPHLVKATLRAN